MSQTDNSQRQPVVFLMGPTAAGKTALALKLCAALPLEIVSVDSALVYRRLNIGSAKPTPAILRDYPHHLVDIKEPHESYSAAQFREDALRLITEIQARNKIPLLVGGTGLYFRTLESGIAQMPTIPLSIRHQLREDQAKFGNKVMHNRLRDIDPQSAARIHPNDPQRTLRALEIYVTTGRTMAEYFGTQERQELPFRAVKLVCAPTEKASLHKPIAERFEDMLARGFVNEVMHLKRDPRLSIGTPALRAVGYRSVWQYLDGEKNRSQMVHDGIVATRRLAKRQYTWFRRETNGIWLDSFSPGAYRRTLEIINREAFSR